MGGVAPGDVVVGGGTGCRGEIALGQRQHKRKGEESFGQLHGITVLFE